MADDALRCVRVTVSPGEKKHTTGPVLFSVQHVRANHYVLRRYKEFEVVS